MRIGEIAERAGVSVDTVRYYERRGLLNAVERTPSGYRVFELGAAQRIDLIRDLQQLGLTIEEIGDALRTHDAGGATCAGERWRLEGVQARVEAKIADLSALRDRIRAVIGECESGTCTLVGPSSAPDRARDIAPG